MTAETERVHSNYTRATPYVHALATSDTPHTSRSFSLLKGSCAAVHERRRLPKDAFGSAKFAFVDEHARVGAARNIRRRNKLAASISPRGDLRNIACGCCVSRDTQHLESRDIRPLLYLLCIRLRDTDNGSVKYR